MPCNIPQGVARRSPSPVVARSLVENPRIVPSLKAPLLHSANANAPGAAYLEVMVSYLPDAVVQSPAVCRRRTTATSSCSACPPRSFSRHPDFCPSLFSFLIADLRGTSPGYVLGTLPRTAVPDRSTRTPPETPAHARVTGGGSYSYSVHLRRKVSTLIVVIHSKYTLCILLQQT